MLECLGRALEAVPPAISSTLEAVGGWMATWFSDWSQFFPDVVVALGLGLLVGNLLNRSNRRAVDEQARRAIEAQWANARARLNVLIGGSYKPTFNRLDDFGDVQTKCMVCFANCPSPT